MQLATAFGTSFSFDNFGARLGGSLEAGLKVRVEILEQAHPVAFTSLDCVQTKTEEGTLYCLT